jgi:hypothetical protein
MRQRRFVSARSTPPPRRHCTLHPAPHLTPLCRAKQITGGRNGYGAKLANIFSTRFTVETADGRRGRRYEQTFSNNMSVKGDPVIRQVVSLSCHRNDTCHLNASIEAP